MPTAQTKIRTRQHSGKALRDDANNLRLLLKNMPALVWTTDAELRMTSIHGAILSDLDIKPGQILGKHIRDLKQPGIGATLAYERALHGKHVRFEDSFGGRSYEVSIEPLREADDSIIGCMGVALDITESKERLDKVLRMGRIHMVLSSINTLIIRVRKDRKSVV